MVSSARLSTWHGFGAPQRQAFACSFWQKKPLLVRGLLSPDEVEHFCQLTPEELLELACEPDAVSRLIRESGGSAPWEVLHGPLDLDKVQELAQPDSGTISELGSSDLDRSLWTVLVNQVDRVLPEVEELRDAVADFVPRWRVDDVMVSYARTGCSIGAHVDNYDVILLQVSLPMRRCSCGC